jgi:thiol-disulfide isomerase/thioredoxin
MNKIIILNFLLLFSLNLSNLFSQDVITITNENEYKNILEQSKGKVTLINFWATWCPPCVKEFPELVKLYNNYKEKDFSVVFISLDDKSDFDNKLIPFLKKQNVDFVSYFGDFKDPMVLIDFVDKSWQGEIPFTLIYDKEGSMKAKFIGNKTYNQFETEILKYLN